ncbi:MAG TPA: hypothetical protein VFH68_22645 [Polyangia bacterium]|nr:hypothetical protein [Polyangia bacterium]
MSLLAIPQPVDEALGALARRRGLPKEIATLVFSVGRHAIRAFGDGAPNHDEIARINSRLDRCFAMLAADPSLDPDASLGAELKRLAAAVDGAASGAGAPIPPAPSPAAPAPRAPPSPAAPVLAVVHAPVRAEPPRFIARPPVPAVPPPAPGESVRLGRPAAPPAPPVELPPLVVHPFPEAAAAAAERDWYWFALEELNGLGALLAFQRQQQEAEAAARTEERVLATLDTLGWDVTAALRQAWSFAEQRLRDADDVWGPHLVLFALEPEADRVRDWRSGLPDEMQAVIEGTRLEIARGTR